jgi:hypothetical protein
LLVNKTAERVVYLDVEVDTCDWGRTRNVW